MDGVILIMNSRYNLFISLKLQPSHWPTSPSEYQNQPIKRNNVNLVCKIPDSKNKIIKKKKNQTFYINICFLEHFLTAVVYNMRCA